VFKAATFSLEASVKVSLSVLSAYAVSITLWSSSSHADMWYYQNNKPLNFCTEITFISRAIPISAKGSANYE